MYVEIHHRAIDNIGIGCEIPITPNFSLRVHQVAFTIDAPTGGGKITRVFCELHAYIPQSTDVPQWLGQRDERILAAMNLAAMDYDNGQNP